MVDAAPVLQLLDLRLVHVQNAIQRIGEGQPGFVLVFRSPLKSAVADGADRLEGLHPVVGIHLRQSGAIVGESLLLFGRSEEHTSELQSLMRISYAVLCLKKKQTLY